MIAIKTKTLGIVAVAVIFGGIAASAGLGLWKTTSSKEPAKIKSGEFSGMPSPSDIRGSYTWADVAKAFAIPERSVITAFSGTGPDEKVNSLEALYAGKLPPGAEIGTDSVRMFVALYTNLPHEPEAETVLPKTAIDILRAEGKADEPRIAAAEARSLSIAGNPASILPSGQQSPVEPLKPLESATTGEAATQAVSATPASVEHTPAVGAIVGKTTFYDLKSWGFDMKKVEAILGGTGPSSQSIKDYCTAMGLSFSEIKVKLEEAAPK